MPLLTQKEKLKRANEKLKYLGVILCVDDKTGMVYLHYDTNTDFALVGTRRYIWSLKTFYDTVTVNCDCLLDSKFSTSADLDNCIETLKDIKKAIEYIDDLDLKVPFYNYK